MPSIIVKRGLERYRGSVTVRGVTRQKLWSDTTKKSFREAAAWEEEERKKLEEELTATDSWTLFSWSQEYLDYVEQRHAKKTYQEKRYAFSRLLKSLPPALQIDKLIVAQCFSHIKKQAQKRSGYAANKDRKNLSAGWSWGRKYLPVFPAGQNPFQAVERFPEKRKPRYVPPEEDFWKVYGLSEGQNRVMLLAFIHLAARRGELFNLIWSDVDFPNSRIRLWTIKREGGNREPDWLPMTSELRQALLDWWQERLKQPTVDKEHVFVCLDESPANADYYGLPFRSRQHLMRRLCERAKVKAFGFHAIRHLTASILYRKGYSLAHIQAVLRHRNPNTTTRYLRSLGLEHVREALEEGLKLPAEVIPFKKKTPGEEAAEG